MRGGCSDLGGRAQGKLRRRVKAEEGEELHPAVSLFIHPSHPKVRAGVVKLGVHYAEAGCREKEEIGVTNMGDSVLACWKFLLCRENALIRVYNKENYSE